MNSDAFERFEKSQSGLLIPVAVFVLGAIATVVAMLAVQRVARAEAAAQQQLRPPVDARGAPDLPINNAMPPPQNPDEGPKIP